MIKNILSQFFVKKRSLVIIKKLLANFYLIVLQRIFILGSIKISRLQNIF